MASPEMLAHLATAQADTLSATQLPFARVLSEAYAAKQAEVYNRSMEESPRRAIQVHVVQSQLPGAGRGLALKPTSVPAEVGDVLAYVHVKQLDFAQSTGKIFEDDMDFVPFPVSHMVPPDRPVQANTFNAETTMQAMEMLKEQNIWQRPPSRYFGKMFKMAPKLGLHISIEGAYDERLPAYWGGNLANDARVGDRGRPDGENAVWGIDEDGMLVIIAKRRIEPGEEIFVTYGPDYWLRKGMVYHFTEEELLQRAMEATVEKQVKVRNKKVPPNAPCPYCDSGKKFKKCCGKH